ncbi:MAG: undecaprenyl diphosphate synthase [Flavobacteriales bacterium]|jgi:undecaprenyl diphosphate synthase
MTNQLSQQIESNKIPEHVAIIMDGNGRWAENHGEMRVYGHVNGVDSVREALEAASELKVKYLTLYAFSTENWNRPKKEVDALMELLVDTIVKEIDKLHENDVKLCSIGALENLPESCQKTLQTAMQKTAANKGTNLILALSYSGRWEIKEAVKSIVEKAISGDLKASDVSDELISDHLKTKNIPDPELLIRTSGECRVSNFLLWQIAYSELYFTETLWPDFKKDDFYKAILAYQGRERRFGLVGSQKT